MKKIILSLLLISPLLASFSPHQNSELINTSQFTYTNEYFYLEGGKDLYRAKIVQEKLVTEKVYHFGKKPSLIKHFPMGEGYSLIATLDPDGKEFLLTVFDPEGKKYYRRKIDVDYQILDLDIRFTKGMRVVGLLYTKKGPLYSLRLWRENKDIELMKTEFPIEAFFLQWKEKLVHFIRTTEDGTEWVTWEEGKYYSASYPHHLRGSRFFLWKDDVYLSAIDARGGLYHFRKKGKKKIVNKKLYSRSLLSHVKSIYPVLRNGQIALYLIGRDINRAYLIQFSNFSKGQTEGDVSERRFFTGGKMIPFRSDGVEYMLLETELKDIYVQRWEAESLDLTTVDWSVTTGATTSLNISLDYPSDDVQLAYLLDRHSNSKPLEEYRTLPDRRITLSNLEDGEYSFHIHLKSGDGTLSSPMYHVPVFWKYKPEQPRIALYDAAAPRMAQDGRLKFEILNLEDADYYYAVNKIEDFPSISKPVPVEAAYAEIPDVFVPGRYYLHLRSRDRHSGKWSDPLHYLFFMQPYNPENDPNLSDLNRLRSEMQFALQQARKTKDPEVREKWRQKLKEIQKKIEEY